MDHKSSHWGLNSGPAPPQDAQRFLAEGRTRATVAQCRDVLEALAMETGDHDDVDPVVKDLFANSHGMSKTERLRVLRRAMKLITHAAKHVDSTTERIDWGRDDAVALLAMTAAVVRWAQAELRR